MEGSGERVCGDVVFRFCEEIGGEYDDESEGGHGNNEAQKIFGSVVRVERN